MCGSGVGKSSGSQCVYQPRSDSSTRDVEASYPDQKLILAFSTTSRLSTVGFLGARRGAEITSDCDDQKEVGCDAVADDAVVP